MKAGLALTHLGAGRQQGIRELMDLLLGLIQKMQGQTLGRTRTDAGQTLELINQSGQRSGKAAQWSAANAGNVGVAVSICRNRPHSAQAAAAEWPMD